MFNVTSTQGNGNFKSLVLLSVDKCMWKDILVLVSIKTTSEIPLLRMYLEKTCTQGQYTLFNHSPMKRYFRVFQVSHNYKQC